MEPDESGKKKMRELEKSMLEKVGVVIASIDDAKHVDKVIVALYSLAACLFPVHLHSLLGSLEEKHRDELLSMKVPCEEERTQLWNVFYKGSGFLATSRLLLYDIASDWLACFPSSARENVYDVFFLEGRATEIVQVLVPCLQPGGHGSHDSIAVCSNAERLLLLCLLENNMVLKIVGELSGQCQFEDIHHEQQRKQMISRVSQLITAIPDKSRREAPTLLSSHLFFRKVTSQLLHGAKQWDLDLVDESGVTKEIHLGDAILFIGETFARICRRGSSDVLLSEVIPQILVHVKTTLSSTSLLDIRETFESKFGFRFWLKIMEAVNDSHSVERIAEELLHQLAVDSINDTEGYWTLWILFGLIYKRQSTIRFIFVEKFLLWKVFPICCLRWILHFAVFECPPGNASVVKSYNAGGLSETVKRLAVAWSRKEFVQSSQTEQQSYVTAALGLCLENISKEDLDATKDTLRFILQGISCRLESPVHMVRKMASCIALVFSKVMDPQNPLYLDESCQEDTIEWDFGLVTLSKGTPASTKENTDGVGSSTLVSGNDIHKEDVVVGEISKIRKEQRTFDLLDPDEVIDPAMLISESIFDDDDCASEDSDTSSNSSLQPYDLVDDDSDLKRKFSQLVDVVGSLRKSDDAEGVEKALDVAETLIRALPDELKYIAGDLAKTLLQVRCSDITIEGEEEPAEEKRQKALVALIVSSPLESLETLNKLLYSPNVDVSQRIMILDIMSNAAQELASSKILKSENRTKTLIMSASDQPWFIPSNIGPPGAGSWKEVSSTGTPLNWSYSYERELPSRVGNVKRGKTRRWSIHSSKQENPMTQNNFPQYAAAFMLPPMHGFDKKRHGVDLLGRDYIVFGKLIYMLAICMKCAAMHPEASVLASPLLDMLRSREVCHHAEAYVRRSVLFAASSVLVSLHPSYVASAIVEGNSEISEGLDWVRSWALQVAESDTDRECYSLAMACLQLHAEMALQASRALSSAKETSNKQNIVMFPSVSRSIKIPFLN